MMLRTTKYFFAAAFGVATIAFAGSHATADSFSIGNVLPAVPPATVPTAFFVQGQSFTPSIQGNDGSGTAPASPVGEGIAISRIAVSSRRSRRM